jgi:polysaccharide pyruvyl transferase WcaK-like protein
LFIFGGGVPFFEQRSHLIAMLSLVGMARLFRTPYMTWSVSSQVVRDVWAKRIFKWVLDGAAAITYRDKSTHNLFISCGVKKPMRIAADSGYCIQPGDDKFAREVLHRAGYFNNTRHLVALTPRTLRGRDGDAETHYNVKTGAQSELEIECFAAAVDWLWEHGYQPIFIPMNTVAPDDDRIAARLVIERAKFGRKALLVDEEIRPRLAPTLYRHCHLSFVARVHGSITSMVANCPVMMYAFAPKHAGIMQAMDLSSFVIPESDASSQLTIKILSKLISNRSQVKLSMQEKLKVLQNEALIPAALATQIIDQHSYQRD